MKEHPKLSKAFPKDLDFRSEPTKTPTLSFAFGLHLRSDGPIGSVPFDKPKPGEAKQAHRPEDRQFFHLVSRSGVSACQISLTRLVDAFSLGPPKRTGLWGGLN